MTFTREDWAKQIQADFDVFAKTLQDDGKIDATYGVVGGALLWAVRDANDNADQHTALQAAVGDPHTDTILDMVIDWEDFTPTQAAKALNRRATRTDLNPTRDALNALIAHFIAELRQMGAMQPQMGSDTYTVHGDITAANVNIGGTQYMIGSVFNQYTVVRENVQSCPTAPNPPKHFTGRKAELDTLRVQLLGHEAVAITAVKSMGGMGKTTLAQALCHLPDNPFPTVLWADVTQTPSVLSTLQTWAAHADSSFTLPTDPDITPEQIADRVRGLLTGLVAGRCGGPVLVVLDDVWESSYAAVKVLRRAAPDGAHLLITTRQDPVVREFSAKALDLQTLSEAESLVLLQKLRDNPHLTDAHLERAAKLIQGHPLTLELAAASLNGAEDPTDIEDILNDYDRGIQDGSPFDALDLESETPRVLNVVFGRSYTHLPEMSQRHFRALGVFAPDSTWAREMAGALWEIEERRALTDAHKTLRRAAFIEQTATEAEETVRYTQHPLLRAYARALLAEAGELEEFSIRHLQFFEKKYEDAVIDPSDPRQRSVRLDIKNINQAFFWSVRSRTAQLKNIDPATVKFPLAIYFILSAPTKFRKLFYETLVDAARELGDISILAHWLTMLAWSLDKLEETEAALERYDEAIKLYGEIDDHRSTIELLLSKGELLEKRKDYEKALSSYFNALNLLRELDIPETAAKVYRLIGSVYAMQDKTILAQQAYNRALELTNPEDISTDHVELLLKIGVLHLKNNDSRTATSFLLKASNIVVASKDKFSQLLVVSHLLAFGSNVLDKKQLCELRGMLKEISDSLTTFYTSDISQMALELFDYLDCTDDKTS